MAFRLAAQLPSGPLRVSLAQGENVVGSSPACEVTLADPTVSRHHAVLVVLGDRVQLADLGSTNGTTVDGRRLGGPIDVSVTTRLGFGSVEARLEAVDADDLLPALPLVSPPAAREDTADPSPIPAPTTASLGPLPRLVLEHLPAAARALVDGATVPTVAARLGEGLLATLPIAWLEVVDGGDRGEGLLFRGGDEGGDEDVGAPVVERGKPGAIRVRAAFSRPSAAASFAPILGLAADLVAAARGRPATTATAPVAGDVPPPLPDPPTLDPRLRAIYAQAATVAKGDVPALLLGESGTGKEVVARYLHAASPRRSGPFVALNCAALPGELLEAELFGVERGVATGVDARPGHLELAHGGTLFLDEIADLAPAAQAKILRALEEKQVYRLGARSPRPADVRVIAATHGDLAARIDDGRFRRDLYHRLADWRAQLPPLRERRADIPNLAAHFLAREMAKLGRRSGGLSRAASRALCRHPWPGNVRELEREVARAALFLADGELLDSGRLAPEIAGLAPRETLEQALERFEREEIRRTLAATGGDVVAAAAELGMARSTLYRRLRALGLAGGDEG